MDALPCDVGATAALDLEADLPWAVGMEISLSPVGG